jgi:hypothetical protein
MLRPLFNPLAPPWGSRPTVWEPLNYKIRTQRYEPSGNFVRGPAVGFRDYYMRMRVSSSDTAYVTYALYAIRFVSLLINQVWWGRFRLVPGSAGLWLLWLHVRVFPQSLQDNIRSWGPPRPLSNLYRGISPRVKRPGSEADQSSSTSAEVKKRRSIYPLTHMPSWRSA